MQAQQKLTEQALHKLFEQVRGGRSRLLTKMVKAKISAMISRSLQFSLMTTTFFSLIGDDLLKTFGEAYMDGRVDVEGDLADVVSIAFRNGLMSVVQRRKTDLPEKL